jgi:hypothetical protein
MHRPPASLAHQCHEDLAMPEGQRDRPTCDPGDERVASDEGMITTEEIGLDHQRFKARGESIDAP